MTWRNYLWNMGYLSMYCFYFEIDKPSEYWISFRRWTFSWAFLHFCLSRSQISDFGVSEWFSDLEQDKNLKKTAGSPAFMAPEAGQSSLSVTSGLLYRLSSTCVHCSLFSTVHLQHLMVLLLKSCLGLLELPHLAARWHHVSRLQMNYVVWSYWRV